MFPPLRQGCIGARSSTTALTSASLSLRRSPGPAVPKPPFLPSTVDVFARVALARRGYPVGMRRAALAIASLLAVSGCSMPDVTVAHDAGSATVAVGETLRVDFGEVNPSVGDNWFLVGEPDAAVLTEVGSETEEVSDCDGTGCPAELTWDFEAVGEGETTLVFQYCFRTGPEDCMGDSNDGPAPAPVELTVQVTGA